MHTGMMDEIYNMVADATRIMYGVWITSIVFSWRWWLNVALTVLPWIVWIKARDRENTLKLLFVGLIVMINTSCLDNIGLSLHLWHYDWKITPLALMFVPWDYCLFPVVIMLMLQFKPKISPLIKAILFASFCAFIFEPIYSLLGLYQPIRWKHRYSFIIYIPLYLFWSKIYTSKLLNT